MNIFHFSKLRKKLFILFLSLFLGLPILAGIIIINSKNQSLPLNHPLVFIIALAVTIPELIFGWWLDISLLKDLGPGHPGANLRLFTTIAFYILLAYLLSWLGNLKKGQNK